MKRESAHRLWTDGDSSIEDHLQVKKIPKNILRSKISNLTDERLCKSLGLMNLVCEPPPEEDADRPAIV